jgi:hypothetical protein
MPDMRVRLERETLTDHHQLQKRLLREDERRPALAKLREKLQLFLDYALLCPRCLFHTSQQQIHWMRDCPNAVSGTAVFIKIQDSLRRGHGAGLGNNFGYFTCVLPREWCHRWSKGSDKCQWRLAVFDFFGLFLVARPEQFDREVITLGGPAPPSAEPARSEALCDVTPGSVRAWIHRVALFTGAVEASNITMVVAVLVAELWT